MAGVVWWHKDAVPKLGCLEIGHIRAISGGTIAENKICEGFYDKSWYPCILLHLDKGKILFLDVFIIS